MTIVQTRQGSLRGSSGVTLFRGIPYATAERFRAPEPIGRWVGQRDARSHGPIAPQPRQRVNRSPNGAPVESCPQDEACLTLSIASPAMPANNALARDMIGAGDDVGRPVIVFLHGGGYETGAGSLDVYDPDILATGSDAVVVSPNFRLGALGFLHLPGVAEGNMGLQDIIAALRWVRENIAGFGGDPANVTVLGHEAGGHAALCLLTMWESQGLFQRVILQSCPVALPPQSRATALKYANRLCEAAGVEAAALAALPTAHILAAQAKLSLEAQRFADLCFPFMPVLDDLSGGSTESAARFISAVAQSAANHGIALIIGTTREEMFASLAPDIGLPPPAPQAIANRFTGLAGAADAITLYRHRRAGGTDLELLGDLMTDHLFLFPSLSLADAVADAGGLAWVYQFDWAPRGSTLHACHGIDLACLFGNTAAWGAAPMLADANDTEFSGIGQAMRAAWSEFVHTNDPDAPGLPWPPYRRDTRMTMRFDVTLGPVGDLAGAAWRGGVD